MFVSLLYVPISSGSTEQYVNGSRIYESGREVIWRGYGGSYLFHEPDNYIQAYELHLPEIQTMNITDIRLAFRFPNDTIATADELNYTKMDEVLDWLYQHGIRGILDNHGGMGFGEQWLIDDWKEMATHYKDDPRIIAFEIFNEPYRNIAEWINWEGENMAIAYGQLIDAVREIDPDRICIQQMGTTYYKHGITGGPIWKFVEHLRPNVVFTKHSWWTRRQHEFKYLTIEQIATKELGFLVEVRDMLNVPVWHGEFGLGGGGNRQYEPDRPDNQVCEAMLHMDEELGIGWNLWGGSWAIDKPWYAEAMFPIPINNNYTNSDLIRSPFVIFDPKLTDYIVDYKGIDVFEPYQLAMWHNNDWVIFSRGIVIFLIETQVVNGTSVILDEKKMAINFDTEIRLHEGGDLGDRNYRIYPVIEFENWLLLSQGAVV